MESEPPPPVATRETTATVNPWVALVWWSAAMVFIAFGLSWVLPPIVEGYRSHQPAVATVTGRTAETRQRRQEQKTTYFHSVTWTDDRGQVHNDQFQIGWQSYAPGTLIKVHYALRPDGSTRLVWERNLHPALCLLALIGLAVTTACSLWWLQALWRVFRAPPESGPTPGSDLSP